MVMHVYLYVLAYVWCQWRQKRESTPLEES